MKFITFVALTAVVSATVSAQTESRVLKGQNIAIYNLAGKITVEPGTGSEVTVEITRGGSDKGKLSIADSDIRGANTLRVLYPDEDIIYPQRGSYGSNSSTRINSDGTWGGDRDSWSGRRSVRVRSSGRGAEAWADIKVLVPAGKQVAVYLLVGELEANRISSDLRLETGAGSIRTTGTKGALHVDAGSGGVDVRDASGSDMSIETGSGGVSINGVSGRTLKLEAGSGSIEGSGITSEDVSIETGSGGIRVSNVTANGRVKLEAGSGSIQVEFKKTPSSINAEAGSGGVTLTLPASLSAEVDLDTGSGGIDTDFAVTANKFSRNHLRGKIGSGDAQIHVESGSGSVRLRKA